jgi:hypothetical protein
LHNIKNRKQLVSTICGEDMTFRPYAGKIKLGDSGVFLDISDFSQLPDGYVLSRVGGEIIATLIDQQRLALSEPQNASDAATKSYIDARIVPADPSADFGHVQLDTGAIYFVDSDGYSHHMMADGLVELSQSTSIVIDLDPALPSYRTVSLTGDTTFSAINLGLGRGMSLRLVAGDSPRALAFPALNGSPSWNWLGGSPPPSIPANKIAILSVISYGSSEGDIVAGWSYTDSSSISGGGDAGQVAFFNGSRVVTGESDLQWDNSNNRLLIGPVETPSANLHVAGTAIIEGAATIGGAASVSGYLQVDGYSVFNGTVSAGGNLIVDVLDPIADTDAVNKKYLETRRLFAIQNMTGNGNIDADKDVVFILGSGGSTVRLPLAEQSNTGKVITVKKVNSGIADGICTAASSGQMIDGVVADGSTAYSVYLENETVTLISNGHDWYVI